MQRLSGLDASFLYLESPSQPLHVCSIMELDTSTMPGGYTFERFRENLEIRVKAMPTFREKLADSPFNPDHPVWIEDRSFSIDRHLHRIGLPPPGGRAELAEIAGHLAGLPLDRTRPLWEMWVIEGLSGGAITEEGASVQGAPGTRIAVLTKMHHASVDGVSGANLMSVLCSIEPDAPPPDPQPGPGDATELDIVASGLARFVARPLKLVNVVPSVVSATVHTVQRVRSGAAMTRPFSAPKTAFNAVITGHRNIAYTQLDLEDIKKVKDHFGVKVNDVVMALVSGALRQFLIGRKELPAISLVATVPVSVHGKTDRPGRNQVSAMFSRLETQIDDPVERLAAIARSNATAKEHSSAIPASLLQDFSQFAAPAVFGVAMRLYASTRLSSSRPVHNLVVSNVPGPQVPLYFLGCDVTAMYPLGPLFHGSGLNITVLSLNGKLDVGLISCPELLPDLWDLADGFDGALKELLAATR